jgi:AcrR family transcriptional regulator
MTMNKGERTRAAILEAAVELLGRAGPDGFSAAALAREAGVSKATLFHHFETLDMIPLAALEQHLLSALAVEQHRDLPLREFLEALGRGFIATADERRDFLKAYFVFFTKAIFDQRFRARLTAGSHELHQAMTRALAPRVAPARVETTARLVEMALDGLGLHLLVVGDMAQIEQAWSMLVDLVTRQEEGT